MWTSRPRQAACLGTAPRAAFAPGVERTPRCCNDVGGAGGGPPRREPTAGAGTFPRTHRGCLETTAGARGRGRHGTHA